MRKKVVLYILLIVLAIIFLLPIIWVMASSFKGANELFSYPPTLLGKNPSLANYSTALTKGNFALYFTNTLSVTLIATFLTLCVNVMSGYVFAKYDFKGKNILFVMVLATLMIPLEVIMIPIFKVIVTLHLFDNLWGLIIPAVASPTAVFLVRQYYKGIPSEFIEAGRIDGASEWTIFTHIMLPMAGPVLAVLAILSFMWRWNDYLWPMLVVNSRKLWTIQLALANYSGEFSVDWNSLLAISSLAMLPVLVIFIALQKYIIGGITAGGVKG